MAHRTHACPTCAVGRVDASLTDDIDLDAVAAAYPDDDAVLTLVAWANAARARYAVARGRAARGGRTAGPAHQ